MKSKAFVSAAISVAILSSSVWSLPANAAPNPAPNAPTPTLVKALRVDVDGDGKYDTVQLFSQGGGQFQLKVTTSKATSAVTFANTSATDPRDVWYGAAKLDGVKGNELIVRTTDNPLVLRFYTWRKGSLVVEAPPAGRRLPSFWDPSAEGYRFITIGKRRYADYSQLGKVSKTGVNTVKITRSAWRRDRWVKTSTRTVRLSAAAWRKYRGINAPTFVGMAKLDIDGDGKLDTVTERKPDGLTTVWEVVTAAGKKAKYTTNYGSLVGLAEVDGIPGAELIIDTNTESRHWVVFTWEIRKLIKLKSPERSSYWRQFSDSPRTMGYEFAVAGGQRELTVIEAGAISDQVFFTRYLWDAGTWSKQNVWTQTLDETEREGLCRSFCGVHITKL